MNHDDNFEKKSAITRRWKILAAVALAVIVLLIFIIINSNSIKAWLFSALNLLRPIWAGLILAYLLNPIFRFFERKVFWKLHPLFLRRALSLTCSYLFLLLLVALLVVLIIPQLISSTNSFIGNYPAYLDSAIGNYNNFVAWLNSQLENWKISQTFLKEITDQEKVYFDLSSNLNRLVDMARQLFPNDALTAILSLINQAFSGITQAIFAFFISLYMLSAKERVYSHIMRARRALFNDRANAYITRVCTVMDRSFGSFLEGKFFDSLVIGILSYFVLLIFRIPYPILNAAIIGITNVVPIIGPFFGAIPTAIIVAFDDPTKVIPFLIIVLVIQQIDGNIIGPKILGSSNGFSSLFVLFAIMIMGRLWGFVGMLVGVPLFATVMALAESFLRDRLRAKGLSSTTENYYPADSLLDPATDMRTGTERWLRKWEAKVLHLRVLQERGKRLSKWDRFLMWLYQKARKISFIPPISAEARAQFAVQEAIFAEEEHAKHHN